MTTVEIWGARAGQTQSRLFEEIRQCREAGQRVLRSAYCGLCRRIDALHGLRGRFSLSYDLTFLNILLCSLCW